MSKYLISPTSLCILLVICAMSSVNCFGKTLQVRVDASKKFGPVPDIFSSSVWIANSHRLSNGYIVEKFLDENQPAVIQLTLRSLRHSKSFEDFQNRFKNYLRLEPVITLMKKVKQYKTTLIVGFETASMPRWLSSNPGNSSKVVSWQGWTVEQSSPPRDYHLWSEVVKFVLQSLIKEFDLEMLGLFVGHEPDDVWFGDEKSFFRFYEHAAKAAKELSQSIVVGGIGTTSAMSKKKVWNSLNVAEKRIPAGKDNWNYTDGDPMLKNFIEYVGQHDVPLDFLNWHSFGILPDEIQKITDNIRQWLTENGFDENKIILYPSDWTYWKGPYPADYLDTEEAAAYTIHALYYMWKGGIDWHGHDFDIDWPSVEQKKISHRDNSTFIGNWSIFTRNGVIKPIYNALRTLSFTANRKEQISELIKTDFPHDDTVVAISVVRGGKIYVLLSNYFPVEPITLSQYVFRKTTEMMPILRDQIKSIRNCMKEKRQTEKNRKLSWNACKDEIKDTLRDPTKIEAVDFLARIYGCSFKCLEDASAHLKSPVNIEVANRLKNRLKNWQASASVEIEFINLPFNGKMTLTTYTIDSSHSNACRFNKKTEPSRTTAPCGIGGVIDQTLWRIKQTSRKEAENIASDYLLSLGYTEEIVNTIRNKLKYCGSNIRKCAKQLARDKRLKSSSNFARIESDIKKALEKYRNVYYKTYYYGTDHSINSINSWNQVSLEGSKQTKIVRLKGNRCTVSINMEQNSIWLLVLSQRKP